MTDKDDPFRIFFHLLFVWWTSQFMLLRNKFVISPSWPCSASSIWRATWRPQIPLIKRESSASRALATRVWKTCARASPLWYLRNLWPIKGNIYAAYKPHATKCSTPQTPLISNKYTKILYTCTKLYRLPSLLLY